VSGRLVGAGLQPLDQLEVASEVMGPEEVGSYAGPRGGTDPLGALWLVEQS